MDKKIKVGIVGGTGYTGGELIRLLLHHPYAELSFATSRTHAGKAISDLHPDLLGETALKFIDGIEDCDLLFLCLPHKVSKPWLEEHQIPSETKIIDLGNDFRLDGHFKDRNFVYGLLEVHKEAIKNSNAVANSGCFASGIQYALLPLAAHKKLDRVFATGITGSTGAGVTPRPTTHYSWRNNNVSAYKTLTHQHIDEIKLTLEKFNEKEVEVNFVPWRGDFPRGIFISSTLDCKEDLEEVYGWFEDFYKDEAFVKVSRNPISLKQIVNTNNCVLHLEKNGDLLVVHSAIDNLLKGASGQAIQNMNLMFGWDEKTGLNLKAMAY